MRSVFAHLINTSSQTVAVWLDSFVGSGSSSGIWRYPNEEDPVLYIEFCKDYRDFEPEDYEQFVTALNQIPSVSVAADVCGRVNGTTEVMAFTTAILKAFTGVAQDDYSNHCWTLAEIESNVKVDGLRFFDFEEDYRRCLEEQKSHRRS